MHFPSCAYLAYDNQKVLQMHNCLRFCIVSAYFCLFLHKVCIMSAFFRTGGFLQTKSLF